MSKIWAGLLAAVISVALLQPALAEGSDRNTGASLVPSYRLAGTLLGMSIGATVGYVASLNEMKRDYIAHTDTYRFSYTEGNAFGTAAGGAAGAVVGFLIGLGADSKYEREVPGAYRARSTGKGSQALLCALAVGCAEIGCAAMATELNMMSRYPWLVLMGSPPERQGPDSTYVAPMLVASTLAGWCAFDVIGRRLPVPREWATATSAPHDPPPEEVRTVPRTSGDGWKGIEPLLVYRAVAATKPQVPDVSAVFVAANDRDLLVRLDLSEPPHAGPEEHRLSLRRANRAEVSLIATRSASGEWSVMASCEAVTLLRTTAVAGYDSLEMRFPLAELAPYFDEDETIHVSIGVKARFSSGLIIDDTMSTRLRL
jgi:hypothetical protein